MLDTMQVDSAAHATRGGAPTGAGVGRPPLTRERENELLARLDVTVSPDPGPERLAAWDALISRTANSDVAQLSSWATLRRMADYEPLYVLATAGDEVLGGAMVLRRTVKRLGCLGYTSYGPSIDGDLVSIRPAVRERLADTLSALARSHLAFFLQPPDSGNDIALELVKRGFRFSNAGIAPAATLRVDLTQPEDVLRGNLSRRLRTWTRQWPQRGVKVRTGDERDIPLFAPLAASTANHQGFPPFPESYLQKTYAELDRGGHAVLLLAELAGTPVAGELMTGCGGVLKSRITGMDRSNPEVAKLNVAGAMIWEAISWGKANGYHAFDFGGLHAESVRALRAPGPVDQDALAGQDLFKLKFGGDVFTYPPALELIHSRVLRGGYDVLRSGEGGQKLVVKVREALRGGR
jgi:lipid II:glycine glycyltransferase (peptidoglycan interpeptide bridge formation enzyme)